MSQFPFNFEPKHDYWVMRLAASLQRVLKAKTIQEAQSQAGEELSIAADPIHGVKDIDDEVVLDWRVSVLMNRQEGTNDRR